jgi:CDGSH-type Zn-finger protein
MTMSESEQPVVAGTAPVAVSLEAGKTYYWCACGKSAGQPFCDGSHTGSAFAPKGFSFESGGEAHLCMCKQTKNPPYCDGSHRALT